MYGRTHLHTSQPNPTLSFYPQPQDVTHSKMRRRIEKPRILLLDCPLEYKKGESQANVEVQQEDVSGGLLLLIRVCIYGRVNVGTCRLGGWVGGGRCPCQ